MDTLTIESRLNENVFTLQPVNALTHNNKETRILIPETRNLQEEVTICTNQYIHKPFIEANTREVTLSVLQNDCVIPVFSKDNERTIAHQEFIEIALNCLSSVYPNFSLEEPEIRVSHQIKGRIPDAIHKNVKDLLEHEKTQYFERMAFIIKVQIPAILTTQFQFKVST